MMTTCGGGDAHTHTHNANKLRCLFIFGAHTSSQPNAKQAKKEHSPVGMASGVAVSAVITLPWLVQLH